MNRGIDNLFEQEFEPEWMTRRKRLKQESLDDALSVAVDYNWRQEALQSRLRITNKHCKLTDNFFETVEKYS